MTIDEMRIWLRVKVPAEDGTAVMGMTNPVVPEDGPASLRSWVLAALEQRADGATKAAGRMVAALRERSWEGDDVLADQLEVWLGGGVVRDLRPLPLDLDEPAGISTSPGIRRSATAAHRVWPVVRSPEPGRMRSRKSRTVGSAVKP